MTLMVQISTRGLESTHAGVERVPQECGGPRILFAHDFNCRIGLKS